MDIENSLIRNIQHSNWMNTVVEYIHWVSVWTALWLMYLLASAAVILYPYALAAIVG